MSDPAEILKEALKLPESARAALAGSLIDSLDNEVDEDEEQAWSAEIARRLGELNSPVPRLPSRGRKPAGGSSGG